MQGSHMDCMHEGFTHVGFHAWKVRMHEGFTHEGARTRVSRMKGCMHVGTHMGCMHEGYRHGCQAWGSMMVPFAFHVHFVFDLLIEDPGPSLEFGKVLHPAQSLCKPVFHFFAS